MSFVFEMGIAIFAGYDEDGFPVVQFDAQGEQPRVGSIELHHPFGFASLPREPDVDSDGQPKEGQACNLLFATEGDTMHAWVGYDPRFWKDLPTLKKGGSMRYCAPGSWEVFDGDDGTNTLYVPVDNKTKAHVFTVGLDGNGDKYVGIVHADGMALTMLQNSVVIKNAAGDAYIEVNASGIKLNGNIVATGGATFGGPAGALPAAIATTLQTYLGQLETAISQGLTDCGVGPSATGPAAGTAFALGTANRAAAIAAIAAVNTKVA